MTDNNQKKKCPYCGEEILETAKKCRYCNTWLEQRNTNLFIDIFSKNKFVNEKKIISIVFTITFMFLTIVFVILTFIDINEIKACTWVMISILCTLWCMNCLKIIDRGNNNEK